MGIIITQLQVECGRLNVRATHVLYDEILEIKNKVNHDVLRQYGEYYKLEIENLVSCIAGNSIDLQLVVSSIKLKSTRKSKHVFHN